MPGFTHLKNAQPISFAHYLLAYVEMFKRDKKRFLSNIDYNLVIIIFLCSGWKIMQLRVVIQW